jgi:hypothetical protein
VERAHARVRRPEAEARRTLNPLPRLNPMLYGFQSAPISPFASFLRVA